MLLDCLKSLGKQLSSVDREEIEQSYNKHLKTKPEPEAAIAALTDYHKGLHDEANQLRKQVGASIVPYKAPSVERNLPLAKAATANARNLHLKQRELSTPQLLLNLDFKHTGQGLEINSPTMELTRRLIEANKKKEFPVSDALFYNPQTARLTGKYVEDFANKYGNRLPGNIGSMLRAYARALGTVGKSGKIVYTFDEAVRHEKLHKLSYMSAGVKNLTQRVKDIAAFARKNKKLIDKAHAYHYSQYGYELPDLTKDNFTPAEMGQIAVHVEEMAVSSMDGDYETIGLTSAEAAQYVDNWLTAYKDAHGIAALRNFEKFFAGIEDGAAVREAINKLNVNSLRKTEAKGTQGSQDLPRPPEQQQAGTPSSDTESAGEQRPRQTIRTANEAGVVEHMDDEYYFVKHRDENIRVAQEKIERIGLANSLLEAVQIAKSGERAEHTAFQMEVVELLNRQAKRALEAGDRDMATAKLGAAQEVVSAMARAGTDYGQAISQLAEWQKDGDPNAVTGYVQKRRAQFGYAEPLTPEQVQALQDQAAELQDLRGTVDELRKEIDNIERRLNGSKQAPRVATSKNKEVERLKKNKAAIRAKIEGGEPLSSLSANGELQQTATQGIQEPDRVGGSSGTLEREPRAILGTYPSKPASDRTTAAGTPVVYGRSIPTPESIPGLKEGQPSIVYREPGQGDVPVVRVHAVHYSDQQRDYLDSAYYGSNPRQPARSRPESGYVESSKDPRIKQRIYAYFDNGKGLEPKQGVGRVPHLLTLEMPLYDLERDPDGIVAAWREPKYEQTESGKNFISPDPGQLESSILDKGYAGVISDSWGGNGAVVLFGPRTIPMFAAKPAPTDYPAEETVTGQPSPVKVEGVERAFGAFKKAKTAEREYMKSAGLPYNPAKEYSKLDKDRAKKIALEFDRMQHNPQDPEVKAAYDQMIKETLAQWDAIKKTGLKVEFIKGSDPYKNPRNAILDVVQNNHLWVFPTDAGFGGTESKDVDVSGNPLLAVVPNETISGKQVRVNDIFRIVHDYFGHIKDGNGFRAEGEENAWVSHSRMYSPLARRAMTTETRGQNSWVNFGPYAESNKTASPEETQYAPQKIGLLPHWVSDTEDIALASITKAAKHIIDTPEFKKWFGDSKVVDENGNPLRVYRGDVDSLNNPRFFTSSPKIAEGYAQSTFFRGGKAPQTTAAYLSLKNPLVIDALGKRNDNIPVPWEEWKPKVFGNLPENAVSVDKALQYALEHGHDGLIVKNVVDTADPTERAKPSNIYATKSPNQIKSAIGNSGVFDESNSDILAKVSQAAPSSSVELLKDPEKAKKELGLQKQNSVREIATALENYTKKKAGLIDYKDRSDKARDQIAGGITSEVMHQLDVQHHRGSGLGWYSNNYPRALAQLSKIYPEFRSDNGTKELFTIVLALTSNGEKVQQNLRNALEVYDQIRAGKKIADIPLGTVRQQGYTKAMDRLDGLIKNFGMKGTARHIMEEVAVRDVNATLRSAGQPVITGYPADAVMPRAVLYLGPKLGAFAANLLGSEGYLTMDLWWCRSFNRHRADLVPQPTQQGLDNFRTLLGADSKNLTDDELIQLTPDIASRYGARDYKTQLEILLGQKEGATNADKDRFWKMALKRVPSKTLIPLSKEHKIEKAANTIYKDAYKALNEAPNNTSDRAFMIDTAIRAQEMLRKTGVDLSVADMQAAEWYYEKRLYAALGKRTEKGGDDVGYEEAIDQAANADRPRRLAPRLDRQPFTRPDDENTIGVFESNKRAAQTSPGITTADGQEVDVQPLSSVTKIEPAAKETETKTLLAPNGKPSNLSPELYAAVRTPEFQRWFGNWEKFTTKEMPTVWYDDKNEVSKVVDDNGEPLVVWHGTEQGGFGIFAPHAGRKIEGTVWFTKDLPTAKSYSGTTRDVTPEDPEIEMHNFEPQRGVYPVFLNIRNPYETDFEGANWDGDRPDDQWVIQDEDGEDYENDNGSQIFNSLNEAKTRLKELKEGDPDVEFSIYHAPPHHETTDGAAVEGLQYDHDGTIIRNVTDSGVYGVDTGHDLTDVFVAHKANQIKSVYNTGEFNPDDPHILRSVSPEQKQDLVDYTALNILEDRSLADTINALDKAAPTLTPEEKAEIHLRAWDMLYPHKTEATVTERARIRLEHYRQIQKTRKAQTATVKKEIDPQFKKENPKAGPSPKEGISFPKTPSATSLRIAEIAQDEGTSPEQLHAAILLQEGVVRDANEAAKAIQEIYPDLSAQQALHVATLGAKFRKSATDQITAENEALRKRQAQAKGQLLQENKKKNVAQRELMNRVKTLEKPPPTYAHRIARLYKAALVSAAQTAIKYFAVDYITRGVMMSTDLTELAINSVLEHMRKEVRPEGIQPGIGIRNALGLNPQVGNPAKIVSGALGDIVHSRSIAMGVLDEFPTFYDELFSGHNYAADVEARPEGKIHGAIDAGLRGAEWTYDKLNVLTALHFSLMRSMEFNRQMQMRLAGRGLDYRKMVETQDYTGVTPEDIKASVKEALRATYTIKPDPDTLFGSLVYSYERHVPALLAPFLVTFPRMAYNIVNFIADYTPVVGILKAALRKDGGSGGGGGTGGGKGSGGASGDGVARGLAQLNSRDAAKQIVGILMFLMSLMFVRLFGDDDKWYLLKVPGATKDGEPLYVDVRGWEPFASFLFMANKFNRILSGKAMFSDPNGAWAEVSEALIGGITRNLSDSKMFEMIWHGGKAAIGVGDEHEWERASYIMQQQLGDIAGAWMRPLKAVKDLVEQFDDYQAEHPDLIDHPVLQGVSRSLPFANSIMGADIKRNYVTGKTESNPYPVLRIAGVNLVGSDRHTEPASPALIKLREFDDAYSPRDVLPAIQRQKQIKSEFWKAIRDAGPDIEKQKGIIDRLRAAEDEGKLTSGQVAYIKQGLGMNEWQSRVKSAPWDQTVLALQLASADEKNQVRDIITKRLQNVRNPISDKQAQQLRDLGFDIPEMKHMQKMKSLASIEDSSK